MRKYFIILLSLISISVLAQRPSVDSLYLKPQIGYPGKTISSKTIFGADSSKFETKYSANQTYVKKITDSIQFKINSLQNSDTGTVFFDGVSLNVRTAYDGVIAQVNREIYTPQPCKNTSGVIIQNGAAVRITGATGNNLTIAKASFSTKDSASGFIGLATMQIGVNQFGIITTYGSVGDLNTSMYDEGDTLYLYYNGGYTTTKPINGYAYKIGTVTKSHNTQGTIFVNSEKDIPERQIAGSNLTGFIDYNGRVPKKGAWHGGNILPIQNFDTTLTFNGQLRAPYIFAYSTNGTAGTFNTYAGTGAALRCGTNNPITNNLQEWYSNGITVANMNYLGKLTANGGLVSTGVPLDSNYIKFKGTSNTTIALGLEAGQHLKAGANTSTLLGFGAGWAFSEGTQNVILGQQAAFYTKKMNRCILIGPSVNSFKRNEINDLLIIDNGTVSVDTTTQFIAGNMAVDTLRINAQTRIGKGVNYTGIEPDGTLIFNGTATVWDDISTTISADRVSGATLVAVQTGIYQYRFAVNNSVNYPAIEVPHSYKEGSDLIPHLHFTTNGTDNTDRYVKWQLDYAYVVAPKGSAPFNAWSATQTTSVEVLIPANTADKSEISFDFPAISDAAMKMGARIQYTITRIAAAGTAPSSNPFLTQTGVHYEIDTEGSRTINSK